MPKFRGRFCLAFQDIINMDEACSLEMLEHVYHIVGCHILEDHNLSFHPSKDCSPDEGKAWYEVTIPQTYRKTRLPLSGMFPYICFWFTAPCLCVIWQVIVNISEYTVAQLVEALHNKQKVEVNFPTVSLGFFINFNHQATLWYCGRLSLYHKWVPRTSPVVKGSRC
jgi:hypothetical protein